jgi:hypothetical protein
MIWRRMIRGLFRIVFLLGILAIPVGVGISFEPDGGTPAIELHRKKWLARTVLLAGGGAAMLAATGLYAVGLADRDRSRA